VTIDENSTVKYASDAFEDILGYTSRELVNESLLAIIPERFHEKHRAGIARYLREGRKRREWGWIELPGLHRDGHEVPLGVSFGETTIEGEQRFTALVRDITDRTERQRELERTRDLLQHTERIADVGGWELDPDTLDVFWTDHLFELLGVDYDEVVEGRSGGSGGTTKQYEGTCLMWGSACKLRTVGVENRRESEGRELEEMRA
jgi:PAS domain S-box-containing protein